MIKYLLTVMALLYSFGAQAQVLPHLSYNASSTIAATNTFQSVQAANPGRLGCVIQNQTADSMWVYFGPCASATKGSSVLLNSQGMSVSCGGNTGNVILTDQVCITGTMTDAFYANFQ